MGSVGTHTGAHAVQFSARVPQHGQRARCAAPSRSASIRLRHTTARALPRCPELAFFVIVPPPTLLMLPVRLPQAAEAARDAAAARCNSGWRPCRPHRGHRPQQQPHAASRAPPAPAARLGGGRTHGDGRHARVDHRAALRGAHTRARGAAQPGSDCVAAHARQVLLQACGGEMEAQLRPHALSAVLNSDDAGSLPGEGELPRGTGGGCAAAASSLRQPAGRIGIVAEAAERAAARQAPLAWREAVCQGLVCRGGRMFTTAPGATAGGSAGGAAPASQLAQARSATAGATSFALLPQLLAL